MTLLHVPPTLNGRQLNSAQRAALLMQEGETWVTWEGFIQRKHNGEEVRIVALIWHGEFGSMLRGPRDHLEDKT